MLHFFQGLNKRLVFNKPPYLRLAFKIYLIRIPALGAQVQIGHFYDGHTRKLLTAYPRMFDDEEYNEMDPGSSYEVCSFLYLFFLIFCFRVSYERKRRFCSRHYDAGNRSINIHPFGNEYSSFNRWLRGVSNESRFNVPNGVIYSFL